MVQRERIILGVTIALLLMAYMYYRKIHSMRGMMHQQEAFSDTGYALAKTTGYIAAGLTAAAAMPAVLAAAPLIAPIAVATGVTSAAVGTVAGISDLIDRQEQNRLEAQASK